MENTITIPQDIWSIIGSEKFSRFLTRITFVVLAALVLSFISEVLR
jgi:hypothetical protein